MFKFVKKFASALQKTRGFLASKIDALFYGSPSEERLNELRRILYEADMGEKIVNGFIEEVRPLLRRKECTFEEVIVRMEKYIHTILSRPSSIVGSSPTEGFPFVILMVGINGSGKTTSAAKLAYDFKRQGKKVLLGAADTFRAAAVDQLTLWAERIGVDIVKSNRGGDPSSVVFDTLNAAKNRSVDLVIIDTAGRVQNKSNLMQELEKMRRVCGKLIEGAPHETVLVLDATVGQHGIEQARSFHSCTPLTAILISKLEGTAKGGVLLPLYAELGIPIKWVGIGEGIEDLAPFDPVVYTTHLFQN